MFDRPQGWGETEVETHLTRNTRTVQNDFLFLPSEMEHIAKTMRACAKENVDYIEIQSDYGHDAFLVEIEKFDQYVRDALC